MKTNLTRVSFVILLGFLITVIALGRIQLVQRSRLVNHPLNRNLRNCETQKVRGGIYDRQGETLASTKIVADRKVREYPLGATAAHLLGYYSLTMGSAGVENWYNNELIGKTGNLRSVNFWRQLAEQPLLGYNLQLSIDADLQRLSYRLLQGKKGAALTIKPSTGEILSAVSSPGFNPEKIEANWELYSQSEEHLLFNRAFQGLYPPGSTFKLITFAAALENNSQNQERQFYCPGFIEINGRTLNCIAAHGDINLKDGLAFSCNVVFAQLGMELGENLLRKQAEQAGLDRNLDLGFPVKASKFSSGKEISLNGVAESSIGQGQVAVTPLEMALITAAVANDGVLMQPYLLKAKGPVGQNLESFDKPKILTRLMKDSTAAYLKEAMGAVIAYGTGWQAQIPGIKVAGKTGSAENPHGSAHAWFIGFAPLEDPEIAVAVVVENAGSGGSHAAPIAREIIRQALTRTFNN